MENGDNVDDKGESLMDDTVSDVSVKGGRHLCKRNSSTILQTGGTVDGTCYVWVVDRKPCIIGLADIHGFRC